MKQTAALVCILALLLPAFASADQPDPAASLSLMLREETIDADELRAVMAGLIGSGESAVLPAEQSTMQADILTYVCYYIAFTAIVDFIDCLVYYDMSYDCRSGVINGLLFYYFC